MAEAPFKTFFDVFSESYFFLKNKCKYNAIISKKLVYMNIFLLGAQKIACLINRYVGFFAARVGVKVEDFAFRVITVTRFPTENRRHPCF